MNRTELEPSQHHLMENSDFKKKNVPGAFENASLLAQVQRKTRVATISTELSIIPGNQGSTGLSCMVGTLDMGVKWSLM